MDGHFISYLQQRLHSRRGHHSTPPLAKCRWQRAHALAQLSPSPVVELNRAVAVLQLRHFVLSWGLTTLLLAGRGDQERLHRAVLRFFENWDDLAVRKKKFYKSG